MNSEHIELPAQPAREWVSLTEDEAFTLVAQEMKLYFDGHYIDRSDAKWQLYAFVRSVSNKLREKNAGQPVKEN